MDLATLKKHLYVDNDLDDVIITQYADAAEHFISSYIHSDYDPLNKSLEQAKFLLVGSWFAYRENETTLHLSKIPFGVKAILDQQMSVYI